MTRHDEHTVTTHRRRRMATAFAGTVLVGSLGFGALAAAAGDTNPGGDRVARAAQLTDEQKCDKADEIIERVNGFLEKLAAFEARLEELKAKAEAAGRDRLVAKIDDRLERLNSISEKIAARLAEFEAWVAEHCT